MKEKLISLCLLTVLLCALVLPGCADGKEVVNFDPTTPHENYRKVEPVGEVPHALNSIVQSNLFENIVAFDGVLLKVGSYDRDEVSQTITRTVQMLDPYGNELASYTVRTDDAYYIDTLTATDDGGFLFVLGFEDYAYGVAEWASSNGYASRIIKCDKDGALQFDVSLDGVEGSALRFCFEKEGKFYFFGSKETPEMKTQGVYSPTDIYMSILDKNGTVLKSQCIAGSDYDSLHAAELSADGFLLSVSSQSNDGDFSQFPHTRYPVDWVFAVSDELEITAKEKTSGRNFADVKIGEKEGCPVYKSDAFLENFDAGTPHAYIDYGDFYLIVSKNTTGLYEHQPPWISALWLCAETVYSGYDKNGNLLFRAAVDSTLDYDVIIDSMTNS